MNQKLPDNVVGVHVGNPLLALRRGFAPDCNYAGFALLHRMLELALLREGLTREEFCGGFGVELNDCIFMAPVTDPVAAIETIKRELGGLTLLPHCQIGVVEPGGWRCVYPSSEVRLNWLMDGERFEFSGQKYFQAQSRHLAVLNQVVKQLKEGQQGGKP